MTTPSFSKTVISLHWLLWRRSLRSNGSMLAMQVFMLMFALMGLFSTMSLMGLGIVEHSYEAFVGAVCVGITSYVIAAIMMPSGEGQLNPESFATLPVTSKEVLPSLVLIQILQTRGMLALACTAVTTVVSSIAFAAAGVGFGVLVLVIVANILSFITAVVLAEELASLLNTTTTEVKKKDSKAIMSMVAYMVGIIGFVALFNNLDADPTLQLKQLGSIAQWTPFGSATGIATSLAQGQWLVTIATTAITVFSIGGGMYLWHNSVKHRLVAPLDSNQAGQRNGGGRRQARGSIVISWLPYSPAAAVFSRAFFYSLRDSRVLMNIVIIPFMAVYFVFLSRSSGSFMYLVAIWALVVISANSASNDYGQDGPSNWLHITSGISAKDLVPARHWGGIVLPVLMVWVVNLGILIYRPERSTLLAVLLAIGLQFSVLAIAVFLSVFNPFPTAKPGTNPWQDKSGYSAAAFITVVAGFFLGGVPVLPGGIVALVGLNSGNNALLIGGVIVGILIPLLCYWAALRLAIKRVDEQYPEIFAKVRAFVN
jgi:hypothetical protein